MKKLDIECKGIGNLSLGKRDYVVIELEDVDMSFLEDVPSAVIVSNHNNDDLLEAIDYNKIVDYLEEKYDIEKIKRKS